MLLSVAWKPSPIASIATSTPTTPAMPTTITSDAPQRCGRLAMPMRAAASDRRPQEAHVVQALAALCRSNEDSYARAEPAWF